MSFVDAGFVGGKWAFTISCQLWRLCQMILSMPWRRFLIGLVKCDKWISQFIAGSDRGPSRSVVFHDQSVILRRSQLAPRSTLSGRMEFKRPDVATMLSTGYLQWTWPFICVFIIHIPFTYESNQRHAVAIQVAGWGLRQCFWSKVTLVMKLRTSCFVRQQPFFVGLSSVCCLGHVELLNIVRRVNRCEQWMRSSSFYRFCPGKTSQTCVILTLRYLKDVEGMEVKEAIRSDTWSLRQVRRDSRVWNQLWKTYGSPVWIVWIVWIVWVGTQRQAKRASEACAHASEWSLLHVRVRDLLESCG